MGKSLIKKATLGAAMAAAMAAGSACAAQTDAPAATLTQAPVIMRLNQDEFRIAFGVDAAQCAGKPCSGVIRYRVDWQTDDGTLRSEVKQVNYVVSPAASRTIAVDRAYFDTAEGQHKTRVVRVQVEKITCLGTASTI